MSHIHWCVSRSAPENAYKYETHCHTSEASACARADGAKQALFYKERGFKGIIVTDHFLNGNTTAPRDLPWERRVDILCSGYEHAKTCGDEIGLDVFFGWEYGYRGADFLTYGLDKAWLLKHPEVMEIRPADYFELVHAEGGAIVHAHPYREAHYIDMIRLMPWAMDGVEIINSCRTSFENEMASIMADMYRLKPTAGSDNHIAVQRRLSGIWTAEPLRSVNEYADMLRAPVSEGTPLGYGIFDDDPDLPGSDPDLPESEFAGKTIMSHYTEIDR